MNKSSKKESGEIWGFHEQLLICQTGGESQKCMTKDVWTYVTDRPDFSPT